MNIKKIYFQDGSEFEADSDKMGSVKLLAENQILPGYIAIKVCDEVTFHRVGQIKSIIAEGN